MFNVSFVKIKMSFIYAMRMQFKLIHNQIKPNNHCLMNQSNCIEFLMNQPNCTEFLV